MRTMTSVANRLGREILNRIPSGQVVFVSFVEIVGDECLDLLQERSALELQEDGANLAPQGLKEVQVVDGQALTRAVSEGAQCFSANEVQDASNNR